MVAPDRATGVSRGPRGGIPDVVRASRRHPRVLLVALVVLGLVTAAAGLAATAVDAAGSAGVATSLSAALTALAAAGSAAILGWLAVCVTVTALEQLDHRPARPHVAISPLLVRRVVAALLGVAAATSTVGSAAAHEPVAVHAHGPAWTAGSGDVVPAGVNQSASHDEPAEGRVDGPGASGTGAADGADLDPGWTPAAPPPAPRPAPSPELLTTTPRQASAPEQDEVVVRRGDTLWDLAARTLPATATDAEIATEWPRWYAANVDVVGSDPDLLVPGQRLRVPAADARP